MIHHVSLGANEMARARAFYDPVMELLGFRLLKANDESADYGIGEIMFSLETPADGRPASAGNGIHIAFQALARDMVQRFPRLALTQGGTEEGPPGGPPKPGGGAGRERRG